AADHLVELWPAALGGQLYGATRHRRSIGGGGAAAAAATTSRRRRQGGETRREIRLCDAAALSGVHRVEPGIRHRVELDKGHFLIGVLVRRRDDLSAQLSAGRERRSGSGPTTPAPSA